MTKKNWLMVIVLLVLAGVYVFYFTDWFKPKIIHISHTSRAFGRRFGGNTRIDPALIPITFSVEPESRLTEIKVVPLAAWQTNQDVLPVWHLVAGPDSAPVKIFSYGQRLRGLKPEVTGAQAEPLQPNVTYRLFVTAGKAHGQHDFEIKSAAPN
jgi:hypothetical protein